VIDGRGGIFKINSGEYSAMWGSDGSYDRYPRLSGDGAMFYNFSSKLLRKDKKWYEEFASAIDRTIHSININQTACDNEKDKEDLLKLKEWVLHLATHT
jgi:hypothetical protein